MEKCPVCKGTGRVKDRYASEIMGLAILGWIDEDICPQYKKCDTCKGTGEVNKKQNDG
jgi:RecJ-like exonuclease